MSATLFGFDLAKPPGLSHNWEHQMSHEIANVNGQWSFAHVGERGWHGLGQKVRDNAFCQGAHLKHQRVGLAFCLVREPAAS